MHSLNVPFHLLQNRMHSAYQNQSTQYVFVLFYHASLLTYPSANSGEEIMPQPAPIEPVTVDNVQHEVGIIQAFFLNRHLARLHNGRARCPTDSHLSENELI